MRIKRATRYLLLLAFLLSAVLYSCQKDSQDPVVTTASTKTDSATLTLNTPGNYLAVSGTLKISLPDSTYTFDASRDSIAFVNVSSGDKRYFGITAINKEHNMSFGISSPGNAASNFNSPVAGSQLLLNSVNRPNVEYTLPQNVAAQDFGKIDLVAYKQDSLLAKGTFYTFLTADDKAGTPTTYKVKGTFTLQLK
jgi:hypothetical protein